MLLRARTLLPIERPPIDDGAVLIAGDRIRAVGRWRDLHHDHGGPAIDLGDVAILPGLVNAHCHLDYTNVAGKIPPPKNFADWIMTMLAFKAHWSYTEYAESWLNGAAMLVRNGVTTVGDIEAVPELLPEVWDSTPLRVRSFLELTGVKSRRPPREIVTEAAVTLGRLPGGRCAGGLSPHSPYSTTPELLRQTAEIARERNWHIAAHVAESADEFEMFARCRGPLFDWLKAQRNVADCGRGSPVQHVYQCGLLGQRTLAIHVNYLADGDAETLARTETTVVHCPRSHAYFGHERFPIGTLRSAGVRVCLGTDSLATVRRLPGRPIELDMFAEMRAFSRSVRGDSPEQILRMATVDGAHALGLARQAGEISEGAFADLIAVPIEGHDVFTSVVAHQGPVAAVMIGGEWAIQSAA